MWGSTVPAVLSALAGGFRGALLGTAGLETVAVYDGPVLDGAQPLEWLGVGLGDPDMPSVEGQSTHEGLTVDRNRELYAVQCTITVVNGASDVQAPRGRVFDVLAVVGAYLAADPRLGGAVMQAQLGAWQLGQRQTNQGAIASLLFAVDIDAFSSR